MIYFFKKINGEIIQATIEQAYDYIYEAHNIRDPLIYVGQSSGNILKNGMREVTKKVLAYKEELLTPKLKEIIEESRKTGGLSQEEVEFAAKLKEFETKVYNELVEEEMKTAEKIYPQKDINIITPNASREGRNTIIRSM